MAPSWRKVAKAAWIAVPPLVFIKDRWVWIYCVEGRSMSPTLNPQDTLLNRCFRDCVLVHRNAEFRKGDLVVLKDPGTNCHIVKRLVAQLWHQSVRDGRTEAAGVVSAEQAAGSCGGAGPALLQCRNQRVREV
ncbi:unnamed protein product [Prorocentrum cordatum]|uniref:Peptidase S26 domain-containing protein n=1 Tax=Prorocentrum cordatum TaxID=2364126 RepID=A0ABN9RU95_9DINO|nr:unnamed protein product [Polarella glacialis]